ncbi:hypothetical protein C2G38_2152301 [Gigaspora rosea]|uniref:Uncharacterized protein n=1 Tax=Gigaspora rosea TaxID=44941 RepID=A0A397W795_9GLOM|nr:hypothetical protein C2G38_2152301 [Gigaspora rosea]
MKSSKIINQHFPEALNDKQVPEALEFALKVLKNLIRNNKKKETEEIIHPLSYVKIFPQQVCPERSYLSALKSYCVLGSLGKNENSTSVANEKVLEEENAELDPEVALEDLINNYHEVLKGCQNSVKVESTVNDDFILDLIDNYLVGESLVEEEKKAIQEPSNASSLVKDENKTFTYCQESAEIGPADGTYRIDLYLEKESEATRNRIKSEDRIGVEKNAVELAEVDNINGTGIELQALPYHQNSVEAINHTEELDDINKTKMDQKKETKKDNVPVGSEKVVDAKPKLILDKKDPDRYRHFGRNNLSTKDLDEACELWMKKVNELRRMTQQDKKNNLKEKRSNHCPTYFEKSLKDLDNILEVKIEPTNAKALIKKEDKEKSANENLSLTYLSLTDSHQENFGIKSAEGPLSVEGRTANMGNVNRMYSLGYCYYDRFEIEENEHKVFEYYKNRQVPMERLCGGKKKIMDPIENEYFKAKNSESLEDDPQHSIDIHLFGIKSEVEDKIIKGVWIGSIIKESMARIRKRKSENNGVIRKYKKSDKFQHLLTGWSSIQIFDPGGYTRLDPYCYLKETLSKSKELLYDISAKALSTLMILQAKSSKRIWRNINEHFAGAQ